MSIATVRGLRILMVTPHYFPDMGGIETHVYEVGRRLARHGIEVTILTTVTPGKYPDLPPRETIHDGMRIIRVPALPHTGDLCIAPQLTSCMREGRWDLVHCQGSHTMVAPLTMMEAKKAHIPFVVTFHTGGHSSVLRNKVRSLQWRSLRPLFASSEKLIAVSRFEAQYFSNVLHLPHEQFAVIPNGAAFPIVQHPLWRNIADSPLIVSVGRLERYKGHHHMIAALPEIHKWYPDARLLILGSGPYEHSLHTLAKKMGVVEQVEIRAIPATDRQSMARHLLQASLVTLMSEYEAHPVAVMEALSLQCPVLGMHTAGLQELAEQGLIRTVPPGSTYQEIAAAAVQQIKQPMVPTQLTLPTWDECAENVLTIYNTICFASEARHILQQTG